MTSAKGGIRAAVVGTGAISQIMHLPILAEHPDVELAVVADIDGHKARTVAARFGAPEAADPEEVFGREDLDAVVLCTPNHLHEAQAVRALETGKHVFVERPLAMTSEGAARVLAAAEGAGKALIVGLPHRFRPEASALRSFVVGGEMGPLQAVRGIWLTRRVPIVRPTWRHKVAEAGGGALMELGVPMLDLSLWLVGYPALERITCMTIAGDHEVEEGAVLMARSVDGVVFTLEVSSRYYSGHDHYYARVMGADGSGSLPPLEIYRQLGGRPLEVTPRQPRPRGDENPYTNAYRRQLDHFVRVVAGVIETPLPTEQVQLMEIVEAAYRSAREGAEVMLPVG